VIDFLSVWVKKSGFDQAIIKNELELNGNDIFYGNEKQKQRQSQKNKTRLERSFLWK